MSELPAPSSRNARWPVLVLMPDITETMRRLNTELTTEEADVPTTRLSGWLKGGVSNKLSALFNEMHGFVRVYGGVVGGLLDTERLPEATQQALAHYEAAIIDYRKSANALLALTKTDASICAELQALSSEYAIDLHPKGGIQLRATDDNWPEFLRVLGRYDVADSALATYDICTKETEYAFAAVMRLMEAQNSSPLCWVDAQGSMQRVTSEIRPDYLWRAALSSETQFDYLKIPDEVQNSLVMGFGATTIAMKKIHTRIVEPLENGGEDGQVALDYVEAQLRKLPRLRTTQQVLRDFQTPHTLTPVDRLRLQENTELAEEIRALSERLLPMDLPRPTVTKKPAPAPVKRCPFGHGGGGQSHSI